MARLQLRAVKQFAAQAEPEPEPEPGPEEDAARARERRADRLVALASEPEPEPEPELAPVAAELSLCEFLANEGLDDLYERLFELGVEMVGDLDEVTDAEFIERGISLEMGKWLRGQAKPEPSLQGEGV